MSVPITSNTKTIEIGRWSTFVYVFGIISALCCLGDALYEAFEKNGLQDQIDNLQGRINNALAEIDNKRETISSLQDKINDINHKNDSLIEKMTTIEKESDSLVASNKLLREQLSYAKDGIDDIISISGNTADLASLKRVSSDLGEKITETAADEKGASKKINDAVSSIRTDTLDISTNVDSMKDEISKSSDSLNEYLAEIAKGNKKDTDIIVGMLTGISSEMKDDLPKKDDIVGLTVKFDSMNSYITSLNDGCLSSLKDLQSKLNPEKKPEAPAPEAPAPKDTPQNP